MVIRRFFERNPYIIDLLNISRSALTPPDVKHRSSLKIWALGQIKLSRQEYSKRVREHRALKHRVDDEARARKQAMRWAKQQIGTGLNYENKLRSIEDDLLKNSDQVLRWKEKVILGVDHACSGDDAQEYKRKMTKRIRKLASTMSRMKEGSAKEKSQRRIELESYLSTLSEEELWVQELFMLPSSKADKIRRKIARTIARALLASKRHHLQVKKEIELLGKVAEDYLGEIKNHPIYRLFQYNNMSGE